MKSWIVDFFTDFTQEKTPQKLENTKIKIFLHLIIICKKKKTSDLYSTFFLYWVEKITLLPEFVIVTYSDWFVTCLTKSSTTRCLDKMTNEEIIDCFIVNSFWFFWFINDVNELIKYLLLIYGLFSNQKRVKMTFDFMSFSIGVNSIITLQLGSRTRYYLCMWHCDRHINKSGIILNSIHIT